MKKQLIYMHSWLQKHRRNKRTVADDWYLELSNRLLGLLDKHAWGEKVAEETKVQLSLCLTLYLEDCVADAGNWRAFIRWHRSTYGRYLPFYEERADYLVDEINVEDVACVLWVFSVKQHPELATISPLGPEIHALAQEMYDVLDEVFEEAPISDDLAPEWFLPVAAMTTQLEEIPEAVLGDKLSKDVENFLQATKGYPLKYCATYEELVEFLLDALHWTMKRETLFPELKDSTDFVLHVNQKGLLIAPDVALCFADEPNTMYNPAVTREEAYQMFYNVFACPYDLVKYAMKHHLMPDVQFPFVDGQRLLQENWDFLFRWFLNEYIE